MNQQSYSICLIYKTLITFTLLISFSQGSHAGVDPKDICNRGLRVGIAGHFPPFLILSDKKAVGIDVDVAIQIYRALCPFKEIKIILVNSDLAEVFDRLKEKETDVVIAAAGVEEREGLAYSYPYFRGGLGMAVKTDTVESKKLSEILRDTANGPEAHVRSSQIIFEKLIEGFGQSGKKILIAVEKESSAERFVNTAKKDLGEKGSVIEIITLPTTREAPGNLFFTRANIVISDDIFLETALESLRDWELVVEVVSQSNPNQRNMWLIERGDIAAVVRKDDIALLEKINIGISSLWGPHKNNINPPVLDEGRMKNMSDADKTLFKTKKINESAIPFEDPVSACWRIWRTSKLQGKVSGNYNVVKFLEETNETRMWQIQPKLNYDLPVGPCPVISLMENIRISHFGLGIEYSLSNIDNSALLGKKRIETIEITFSIKITPIPIVAVIPSLSVGGGWLLEGTQEFKVGDPQPDKQKGESIFLYSVSLERPLTERLSLSLDYK